jgi:AI-2 transport protein TqsA
MGKSIQYMIAGASAIIIIAGLKIGADLIDPILISLLLAVCISPLPEWLSDKGWPRSLDTWPAGRFPGNSFNIGGHENSQRS